MRIAIAASVLLLAQHPAQPPRFRAGVDVVELDVSVLDRDRRPVPALKAADFTVLEDGQPQDIVAFEEVYLPTPDATASSWVREVPPDVRSNDFTAGRLLVLVLDDATMPPSPMTVATAKKIGHEVIAQLGPQDLAAVLFTLNNSNSQDFTTDHARLTRAVEQVRFGHVRPELENKLWYQYSIQTVRRAAGYLRDAPQRRKTLIYISVGVPVEFVPGSAVNLGLDSDLAHEMQRAFEEAVRSNVTIYAVNPAGLGVENRLERKFLQSISENTGGYAVVNTNAPEREVPALMEESGSYYLLGYQSTNQKLDGKLRRLQVRVNRPGVTVRSRRGYYAPRRAQDAATSRPVADSPTDAIAGVLPKGDLPMHVAVAPFAISGKRDAALAIVTRLEQPAVTERAQHKVEVLTALFDTDGNSKGSITQSVDLTLRPGNAPSQYELLSRFDVKPGRYLLRIGAHAQAIGKSGSVYHDVDVPDFSKAAVSLSGAVLSATPPFQGGESGALTSLIPIVPTTRREFGREHAVAAFVRVYQGGRRAPVSVTIAIRVVNAADREVFGRTEILPPASFSARASDYTLGLPIADFAPGEHVLTIEARAGRTSSTRHVRFSIR
jgi:VWFA-related protein